MLNGLDLFSGIAGLGIGIGEWVRTVAYCERDRYAQAVLLSRMAAREIDNAPIWDDVQTLRGEMLPPIDIIFGGFPCQDISTAGNGVGLEGKRSGLFFEIIRLTSECRPRFVFLENVPAITVRGLDRVLLEFTKIGFDCRWTIVSAAEVGAWHLRERWFLLAHTNGAISRHKREEMESENSEMGLKSSFNLELNGIKESVANASCIGSHARSRRRHEPEGKSENPFSKDWWSIEPNVGRVVNGLPNRVDRLRCLGNAVVPLQAKTAFKRLIGIEGGARSLRS